MKPAIYDDLLKQAAHLAKLQIMYAGADIELENIISQISICAMAIPLLLGDDLEEIYRVREKLRRCITTIKNADTDFTATLARIDEVIGEQEFGKDGGRTEPRTQTRPPAPR